MKIDWTTIRLSSNQMVAAFLTFVRGKAKTQELPSLHKVQLGVSRDELRQYNAVGLLDAPNRYYFSDGGIICKHICLIFCMVKVYYT